MLYLEPRRDIRTEIFFGLPYKLGKNDDFDQNLCVHFEHKYVHLAYETYISLES